jgi:hypothetical protein
MEIANAIGKHTWSLVLPVREAMPDCTVPVTLSMAPWRVDMMLVESVSGRVE